MKKILVTGATGFIGKILVSRLLREGWHVHALTRDPIAAKRRLPPEVEIIAWNPRKGKPLALPEGLSAVAHLAGESLSQWPWNRRRKESLWNSRVDSTRVLVEALGRLKYRPSVLISASGMGFYGNTGEREVHVGDPPGMDFLGRMAAAWEIEALKAKDLGIRVVLPRFGLVLGTQGGVFPKISRPFRFGLGAVLGDGNQYWSWIHVEDAIELLCQVLENPGLQGPVHAVAGSPLTQREFSRILVQNLHKPLWIRIPAPLLRLLLGEIADLLLHGQKARLDSTVFTPKTASLQEIARLFLA